MTNQDFDWDSLTSVIADFNANVRTEVRERWKAWQIDLSQVEVHEVVGGLLARQATLAIELVGTPSLWRAHIAPVLLRTMADAHINLAWILGSPYERSQRFIHYGLGQMKLRIEHHKARWNEEEPEDREREMVEAMEHWLNGQRFSFLTEVNVGSWSEVSVRDMAHEAGISDFYTFSYTPFSAAVHSMWHHIEQYNLRHCPNPLHRYHRIPAINEPGMDPFNAILAAKYFNKSTAVFDKTFDSRIEVTNSYGKLCEGFARIFEKPPQEESAES